MRDCPNKRVLIIRDDGGYSSASDFDDETRGAEYEVAVRCLLLESGGGGALAVGGSGGAWRP